MALLCAMLLSCSRGPQPPITVDQEVSKNARSLTAGITTVVGNRITGSAMVLPGNRLLTNHHVILHREDSIKVTLDGEAFFSARMLKKDVDKDLALIQVADESYDPPDTSLPEILDRPAPGLPIFAYGAAFGLHQSYLQGYVSHSDRTVQGNDPGYGYIQTQGITYSGMSGTPVFSLKGEWIGINRAAYGYSLNTGTGLVIPASVARDFSEE